MICLIWAQIWFADFHDAFDHMKLLSCEQKLSATVTVNDQSGVLKYCQRWSVQ